MNTKQVLRALSEIDETYIMEARPMKQTKKQKPNWGLAAAVAAAMLMGGAGLWLLLKPPAGVDPALEQTETPTAESIELAVPTEAAPTEAQLESEIEPPEYGEIGQSTPTGIDPSTLEMLKLPDYEPGGMGFEAYLAYDVSELESGNPWSAAASPLYLPVYVNQAYDPIGFPRGLEEQELRARLEETEGRLELDRMESEAVYEADYQNGGQCLTCCRAQGEGLTVYAWANGSVELVWDEGSAPAELRFPGGDASQAEAEAFLERLMKNYADRLGIRDPRAALFGDYTYYGDRLYRYALFDAGSSPEQAIVNYALRQAVFGYNEDGSLNRIRLEDGLAAAEKLGDYPIIRPEEAEELLLAGHYQTSVPCALPGADRIAAVELRYRSGPGEQLYLP